MFLKILILFFISFSPVQDTRDCLINNATIESTNRFETNVKTSDEILLSFSERLEEYREIREQKITNDEDTTSIDLLIKNTSKMIQRRSENLQKFGTRKVTSYSDSSIDENDLIDLAIFVFQTCDYRLSEELLTVSRDYTGIGEYIPVFSSVVYSSPVTKSVAFGNVESNMYKMSSLSDIFTEHRNVNDLALSIGRCDVLGLDVVNHRFTISDTYNFDTSLDYDGPIGELVHRFDDLVRDGYLSTFNIKINVDFTELIYPEIISKTASNYTVRLNNFSSDIRTVLYNSKLGNYDDCKNWSNLSDLKNIIIGRRSYADVIISENLAASSLAVAYLDSSKLHITFGDEVSANGYINRELQTKNLRPHAITLLGKDNGSWLFRVLNNTSFADTFEYVSHTVSETTALNWSNTADVISLPVETQGTRFVRIVQNASNRFVSFCFKKGNSKYYVYGNDLENQNQTISIHYRADSPFLEMSNNGKNNGKWNIGITNIASVPITLEYNEKMCFANDARNWNLSNINNSILLNPGVSVSVLISTNFLAGCVAASYVFCDYRFITYANGLANNGSIVTYTSILEG